MFQPLGDRLVIKPDAPEYVTKGGIALPDTFSEKVKTGIVLLVGPGKFNSKFGTVEPMLVKQGDRVLYFGLAGTPLQLDGDEYLILSQQEIMGVFENATESATAETV